MQKSAIIFDFEETFRRKTEGMERAAAAHAELLFKAQRIAIRIGQRSEGNLCNANLVRAAMYRLDLNYEELGNAAGSLFKFACWEPAGIVQSLHVKGHGRIIRVWHLLIGH